MRFESFHSSKLVGGGLFLPEEPARGPPDDPGSEEGTRGEVRLSLLPPLADAILENPRSSVVVSSPPTSEKDMGVNSSGLLDAPPDLLCGFMQRYDWKILLGVVGVGTKLRGCQFCAMFMVLLKKYAVGSLFRCCRAPTVQVFSCFSWSGPSQVELDPIYSGSLLAKVDFTHRICNRIIILLQSTILHEL